MRSAALATVSSATARWCVIALGVSIPISVAADNILIGLVALCWLLGGDWSSKIAQIRRSPVALAALLLFGVLSIGCAYGGGDAGILLKYIDLLLVPAFMTYFRDDATRRQALQAFCIAAFASIIVSYIAHMNLLVNSSWLERSALNPTGFKASITHSIIVALAAYLFALLALDEPNRGRRAGYFALALFAAHNVIFMVFGRTGYLVVAVLSLYFCVVNFGRRGLLMVSAAIALTFAAAYATSDTFRFRIDTAVEEATTWRADEPSASSVGLRLEWYATSLKLIGERPFLGYGTGTFPGVYARAVAGSGKLATINPHNEYLMITFQVGLVGLACLLYLFWRHWQYAAQIATPLYRHLARGLVLTFLVGCLFNSLLLDHTEGLLFAWLTGLLFAAASPAAARAETPP